MNCRVETEIGGKTLTIETGKIAKQADGAAQVSYGGTVVLVAAVAGSPREDVDFLPLTVEYREMTYAAGKFPGGYIKREGRPTTREILIMRLIDRPLRPLFPKDYKNDTQVFGLVLSSDRQNQPDVLAMVGASAAVCLGGMPVPGPLGAVRVGKIDGRLVINPTVEELDESVLDLVVAGTEEAVLMVEAGAKEVSEEELVEAITFGHEAIKKIVDLQKQLLDQAGVCLPKSAPDADEDEYVEYYESIKNKWWGEMKQRVLTPGKKARSRAVDELGKMIRDDFYANNPTVDLDPKKLKHLVERLEREVVRSLILKEGKRCDGRGLTDVRPISCEVGLLPRTHGSALFTRGETQALVTCTLGTSVDEQRVESLEEDYSKKFMLHYNFPPFCVGEVKPVRGPSRREIGHGNLAERAIEPVMPDEHDFPYTVRVVSDIMESNGSSSMATVCGATLCLMDAGVKIRQPVAGIAMGLIKEGDEVRILSDILGTEDHLGDMDFKVAGTGIGVTALQMDIKVQGITPEIMQQALEQAREGRRHILREMMKALDKPREKLSPHAPRLVQIQVDPNKIGAIIGPGGKMVRSIEDQTGTSVEINNDGTVTISAPDEASVEKARSIIEDLTAVVEVGRIYRGRVVSVKDFGAFIEILPGQEGLCHISELDEGFVRQVTDVVKVGQEVPVKVIAIDDQNRIKLSRKAALRNAENGQTTDA